MIYPFTISFFPIREKNIVSFWTHLSNKQGGVALLFQKNFLDRFDIADVSVVVKGRILTAKLETREGKGLQISAVYLTTGLGAEPVSEGSIKRRNVLQLTY